MYLVLITLDILLETKRMILPKKNILCSFCVNTKYTVRLWERGAVRGFGMRADGG